jgi:hypothetical protein
LIGPDADADGADGALDPQPATVPAAAAAAASRVRRRDGTGVR